MENIPVLPTTEVELASAVRTAGADQVGAVGVSSAMVFLTPPPRRRRPHALG